MKDKVMLLRGQTLIGLVVSITLSSFMLLMIISFYQWTQRQNSEILQHLQLQSELQRVIQLIGKDLRRAGFRALSDKVIADNFFLFEQSENQTGLTLFQTDSHNANSCVLFFYDLDMNGCIGTKFKNGICAMNSKNATQEIERELFGYRVSNNMLETRLTYKNSVNQNCHQDECRRYLQQSACHHGGWVDLLDRNEYEISRFTLQWLVEQKGVKVRLKGNLLNNEKIDYETSIVIPLLNATEETE